MIDLHDGGVYIVNNGQNIVPDDENAPATLKTILGESVAPEVARRGTMTHRILSSHNSENGGSPDNRDNPKNLKIKFDSLTSHDITYVGIILTAKASGMEKFPLPFVMTNCHNSLCAVGGTINEDDHMFALSAARKYGGIYVPPNISIIHSYNREMMSGVGRMILGSDSHTRYGALGTMGVGEGGGELAKQLIGKTYDIPYPEVVAVRMTGKPQNGVGPHDIALSIVAAVFESGFVKNKVMEFVGDGISNLPVEFRNGIDVMTTETACWSSIWPADSRVREYYETHGRPNAYKELAPAETAYYDGMISVDLSRIEPVIAMPFHPSNVYTIRELLKNPEDILDKVEQDGLEAIGVPGLSMNLRSKIRRGGVYADQALIAGCAGGTYDNIVAAGEILRHRSIGCGNFKMSVYPESMPTYIELVKKGYAASLMESGIVLRSAFCGPCFGAGDTPANGEFSIRHTTRNFPNREGSKPGEGQLASVALMDARSIAATATNSGRLTPATEFFGLSKPKFFFDDSVYKRRVYDGTRLPMPDEPLVYGPNIKDWPDMPALPEHILLKIAAYITDPVTTTDELIPSGETSSLRSNPLRLAEFTLSRRDPDYVGRAKGIHKIEQERRSGKNPEEDPEIAAIFAAIRKLQGFESIDSGKVGIGSTIYALKPGDGSAREQAASSQRVLGASANLAVEYATKRYRSNLINWGMIPFLVENPELFRLGDYIFVPGIAKAIGDGSEKIEAYVLSGGSVSGITLSTGRLAETERRILVDGSLINHYKNDTK